MQIDGHGVVVTGGAQGLGAACARHFANLGGDVSVLDNDGQLAADVAAEIGGFSQQCDVSEEASVAAAITSAMARFGQAPRIIVNCAGIDEVARIVDSQGDVATALFRRIVNVNLVGTYNVMSYAVQAMMDLPVLDGGERGVIINTAAMACEDAQAGQAAYAASTGGISSLCSPAASELSELGIRVMTIAPGMFRTPMLADLSEIRRAGVATNNSFPDRPVEPCVFARLVQSIVANSYLNGTVIRIDGALPQPSS